MKRFRELALLGWFMVWNGATDTAMAHWVSLGLEGGNKYKVTALTIDSQTPSTIYASTEAGIFKSINGGTSWSTVNNGLTYRNVRGLVIDPQTSTTLYAWGAAGVFKSTNGGGSWTAINNGLVESNICRLAIDSQTPSTIYAGTIHGVYKSVNGGTSWSAVNNGLNNDFDPGRVWALVIDPQTPTTLYAGIFGGGVFKSINGGGDWTRTGTSGEALVIDPQTPATLYAGTWGGGVFKSTNGGASWRAVNGDFGSTYPNVSALAIDPQRPATIYAGTYESRVFKSNDGGGSWTAINTAWMGGVVLTLAIDPQNPSRIYFVTPEEAFVNSLADCSNSISPLNQSYSSSGISRDFVNVTVTGDCGWTAVSHDSWITINSGGGSGNGVVTYSVAQNTSPDSRTGTLAIAGQTFTVTQTGLISSFSISNITPTTGPVTGGTSITINGGGFQVGSSVSLGGVRAMVNTVTSTEITATTGIAPVPGSYDVVVTNPGGQSMELTKGFTYTPVSSSQTGEAFVPIVLSSGGANGSFYTSELTLTNRGTGTATVNFTYTAAIGSGSGTGIDTLAPGRQKIVPDAISYLRSLGVPIPSSGNQGGTLGVVFSGLISPSDGTVTVRTMTAVPEGRAGLAYGGVPAGLSLTDPSYVCGLRQNQTDRSNLAIQNVGSPSDGNITLRVTVFSGAKGLRISKVLPDQVLVPGGFAQVNGILTSNGLELSNGYVRVERINGTAPYYAYGVINDQANSDGSFIPPISESALAGKTRMMLPVAVEVGPFSTELDITNWSSIRKTLNCLYVADAVQMADHAASFTIDLEAGQQLIQPELVQWLRNTQVAGIGPEGPTYSGALFVSAADSDLSGISVAARTSAAGGGGEYGLFYTALAEGTTSPKEAWLYSLQQNSENRSNLALVNTGETDATDDTFQIDLYDGETGKLANTISGVTLAAGGWKQFNTILAEYASRVHQGYAHVVRNSGNNPFIAYAVINDGAQPGQRSGDGAFISSAP